MNDFLQQFKNQKQINESLFGNLFSKSKPEEVSKGGVNVIEKENKVLIEFENGSVAQEVNTLAALPYLQQFDWKNSGLNFLNLPGTKFYGTYLDLDLKNQALDVFMGTWESGPFIGGHFEGVFKGSSFKGDYFGKYTDYESHPTTFIDGTFIDTTNSGLLGIPNMLTLNRAKNKNFHLISIPAGNYLQFKSVNGISGYIKVLKRLDNVNSEFQYEVLDGFKGQQNPTLINFTWTDIRQSWDTFFINPKNTKNIANLIKVPEGDFINEMYISSAPATFKTPDLQFDANQTYKFNLGGLPYLSIKMLKGAAGKFVKPEINLKFDSSEEFDKFKEITSNIQSGVFKQDLKDILKAIKYGEIDGYGPFNYLKFVFNNVQGANKSKVVSETKGVLPGPKFRTPAVDYKNAKDSSSKVVFGPIPAMSRLNEFVKYFVENIVNAKGEPDIQIQNLIISRLKAILGFDGVKTAEVKPVEKTPATPTDTGQGPGFFSGLQLKEAFRKEVRNIIKDNF